jgi:hypothetical protein
MYMTHGPGSAAGLAYNGSEEGPLNFHLFKFPLGGHKLEAVPKPWESTTKIEKIPDGEAGVNNTRRL